jgi:hypothetical protein
LSKKQRLAFHDNKDKKPSSYIMGNLSGGEKSDILPECQAFLLILLNEKDKAKRRAISLKLA